MDEFRSREHVARRAAEIAGLMPKGRAVRIMEVCGTHTHAVSRFGLKKLFPAGLQLIAGPGCPVCVSDQNYIDTAIFLARRPDMITVTFGDMIRVPGSSGSLDEARMQGADVRLVYSPLEAVEIARQNPRRTVVFLAVGFETTAAGIALTVAATHDQGIANLRYLFALKTMPPAMRALLADKRVRIDGFLCPGHVSSIIGADAYGFIPRRYRIGCCVAGFEPSDIMDGVYFLLRQIVRGRPAVENQYTRAVSGAGNLEAQKAISAVFTAGDAFWRGMGLVRGSGLLLRKKFAGLDAGCLILSKERPRRARSSSTGCRCADVLKGIISPPECPLFRRACRPEKPVGPCMVSQEGACHAHFLFQ